MGIRPVNSFSSSSRPRVTRRYLRAVETRPSETIPVVSSKPLSAFQTQAGASIMGSAIWLPSDSRRMHDLLAILGHNHEKARD